MITDQYGNNVLLESEGTLKGGITAMLKDKWVIDQQIDNGGTIYMGGKIVQFVLRPKSLAVTW